MSTWTIFSICVTVLLLLGGSAFTILMFYRAGKRMEEAEVRERALRDAGEAVVRAS